jgi:hypothetical protein
MIPEFHYVDDIADAPSQAEGPSDKDARHESSQPSPDLAHWRYRMQEDIEGFDERMPHENIR